ncbi:DUF7577 domain-containing protein [Halodesulfurarchaeum sp.]|uniref:DUF7577 domain-containing protein n=2 Tax=Halodesulfurarchaeum sp. TaxID=1980530 RepID=UPI002FC2C5EC
MFDQPWEIAFLLGIGSLYALLLLQFVRSEWGETERPDPHRPETVDGSKIVCPECGTANEKGYRYCRSCIGELPKSGGFERDDGHPLVKETK